MRETWSVAASLRSKVGELHQRCNLLSSIAQSVERAAVNRVVVGSSPTRGAGHSISYDITKE